MTIPTAPLQPLLEAHSLRPLDSQTLLTSLLAADGSRCWVPAKAQWYTYHASSAAVPDGNTTVAGLGGGNWIADAVASGANSGGQFNTTLSNGLNSNVSLGATLTGGTIVARIGGPSAAFSIDGVSSSGLASGTEVVLWNTTAFQMTIVDKSSSVSSSANRISTVRGTPVNPVVRSGSLARLTRDSTGAFWVLTGSGYSEPDRYDIRDFGADESLSDNIPALNAAAAAAMADTFCRRIWIPRLVGNTGAHFGIASPWILSTTSAKIYIEFENNEGPIRQLGYLGPVLLCCPPGMVLPNIQQDGSTGFYGVVFTGSVGTPVSPGDPYMYLTAVDTMGLNGLAAFTYETWYSPASFAQVAYLFMSFGSRRVSDPQTQAFTCEVLQNGHVQSIFTLTSGGQKTITSTNALSLNSRQKISLTWTGTQMLLHIGGAYDSTASSPTYSADTLKQGFEDMMIGNATQQWPYGGAQFETPNGTLYQTRWSRSAKYSTANYVPETTPIASTDAATMLLWTPSPTCIVDSNTALMECTFQYSPVGFNANTPYYIQWESAYAQQMPGPVIRNMYAQTQGGVGIWMNRCPDCQIVNPKVIGGNFAFNLYNNCYDTVIEGKAYFTGGNGTISNQNGGVPVPKNWALFVGPTGTGIIEIGPSQIKAVAAYGIVLVNVAARLTRGYWITKGNGSVFAKAFGGNSELIFDNCAPGDEGGQYSDHCLLFTAQDTASATNLDMNVYVRGGAMQQTQSAAPVVEIDGGSQYVFESTAWVAPPTTWVIKITTPPSLPVVIQAQQNTSDNSNVLKPWMPPVGTSGSGRLLLPSLEAIAANVVANANAVVVTPNQFVCGKWIVSNSSNVSGFCNVLTYLGNAAANVQRTIVNLMPSANAIVQGSTNGTTGSGANVIVGAGKRAIVACEDGANWVRVTADT